MPCSVREWQAVPHDLLPGVEISSKTMLPLRGYAHIGSLSAPYYT